ncbi:aminotransferase-like domain-containing protein [Marinobacterium rhizophilum]|uniref:PLP-dependent aminotransferase family protein n=1 Tax=Marinobacterium rhizophilum TaxID=420402 RepID=A0ABY5HH29_9GAMM|nr:PLP-dependent aminotransferase family protein [Marinobacterium rhizophilum]UTW11279.1 PLP-dependent aminotransferase family protein [Marinobacterium rhizophilum]
MKIYEQTAELLRSQILEQQLRPGDPLPSIRELSTRLNIGRNSVIHAYMLLEDEQLIEPRPRSGYYVRARALSQTSEARPEPRQVKLGATALAIIGAAQNARLVPLGSADPDARCSAREYFYRRLSRHAREIATAPGGNSHYVAPPGLHALRAQLARRCNATQVQADADDIVITNGTQEAVTLALLALARPGDTIAVESPCFYGTLQCIEALGMRALEIPGHPHTGMDMEALEQALTRWPVKAILTNPSFNNPTGACMPTAARQRLLQLAEAQDLPIIEDDVFGELCHQGSRPPPLKSLDSQGRVLLCSSLSKTLDSDIRIGWIMPGRYYEQVNYLKYVTTLASPGILQQAAADFLADNRYERHLRQVRRRYQSRLGLLLEAIYRYWPACAVPLIPQGGFLCWIELPTGFDGDRLYRAAQQAGIGITPGSLFASDDRFAHCIRLNYSTFEATPYYLQAIEALGDLIRAQLKPVT